MEFLKYNDFTSTLSLKKTYKKVATEEQNTDRTTETEYQDGRFKSSHINNHIKQTDLTPYINFLFAVVRNYQKLSGLVHNYFQCF